MRSLLLTLFLAAGLNLAAQQKIIEQTIGWRGNAIQLHTISDKTKQQFCTVIVNNDSLKAVMLNSNMQIKEYVNLVRKPDEKLLGGFFKDKKLYLFLDNGLEPGLHNWVIDLASPGITEHIMPFDLKKEKIIDRISCGDHFLYFTIDKKNSEFIIYDFSSEEKYTTTRHAFDGDIWKELTDAGGFSRSLNVEKVDSEGECSADVAVAPNKIYVQNDTLHLIINKITGTTKIFSFSLADQKVNYKVIAHGVKGKNRFDQRYLVDNSFLLKDKLYYLYATSDSLRINVLDLRSGNVMNSFFAKKDEEITFKNSPILQNGGSYAKEGQRELGKTKQLLRKMALSNVFISASNNFDGDVELSIGSYEKVASAGGGMWMYGGAVPTMIWMSTGGFSRNNWTKSARFKMLLNATTGQHVSGEAKPSINERIEEYTTGIKIPAEAENLFVFNQKYYYAFYDRKDRKLWLVEF